MGAPRGYRRQIEASLAQFPVTALLGPRQCGKTTLDRSLAPRPEAYFDLEDPLDLARLEAPRLALGALEHVLRVLRAEPGEALSWATHGGAELDPLLVRGERRWGFEVEYADAPRTTKSMRVALGRPRPRRRAVRCGW